MGCHPFFPLAIGVPANWYTRRLRRKTRKQSKLIRGRRCLWLLPVSRKRRGGRGDRNWVMGFWLRASSSLDTDWMVEKGFQSVHVLKTYLYLEINTSNLESRDVCFMLTCTSHNMLIRIDLFALYLIYISLHLVAWIIQRSYSSGVCL